MIGFIVALNILGPANEAKAFKEQEITDKTSPPLLPTPEKPSTPKTPKESTQNTSKSPREISPRDSEINMKQKIENLQYENSLKNQFLLKSLFSVLYGFFTNLFFEARS